MFSNSVLFSVAVFLADARRMLRPAGDAARPILMVVGGRKALFVNFVRCRRLAGPLGHTLCTVGGRRDLWGAVFGDFLQCRRQQEPLDRSFW